MTSASDFFRQVRSSIREVSPKETDERRSAGAVLLDVREQVEWDAGFIPGAVHIPRGYLEQQIESLVPNRASEVILYCASGVRSAYGAATMSQLGYENVASMAGGINAWRALGLPVAQPAHLTPEQQQRYSRHLLIPEVGPAGQARLLESKVLLVGAGGLGSPAALYLAAAGVGTLGIVDFDLVDVSNLQRQVLHTTDRVGEPKVESAKRTIEALNPDVKVIATEAILGPDNVAGLIDGYDVIIDGTDTFDTRYLLNDAAVERGIPVVHASVYRFEGQLTTFVPYDGPCYRCLYPTPPPPELAPPCSLVGVLGVVPGIMGLLQANEALKLLLGIGETLKGRLLLFDALDGTFSELRLERDPACPACSDTAREARVGREALPLPIEVSR
ncbi:MAG TPA: molybdopterin-synthase adenylyltransferase MoeB [Candidatus Limnocylindrales bacterium]|nr:molybdopterin-synthase adenylyltransferase MoeB [Candidatus Limnocylindrales bacterium]